MERADTGDGLIGRAREGLVQLASDKMTAEQWIREFGYELIARNPAFMKSNHVLVERLTRSAKIHQSTAQLTRLARDWFVEIGEHIADFRKSTAAKRLGKPPGVTALRWRKALLFVDLMENSLVRYGLRTAKESARMEFPSSDTWNEVKRRLKEITEYAKTMRARRCESQQSSSGPDPDDDLKNLVKRLLDAMPVGPEGTEN